MNTETQSLKLSWGTKLGYSIGQMADSIPFNIFYIYFLFFFTDVVGLSPAAGGTISLIVVLWDAVTDPIIGYISDNSKSPYGRRRPFMLAASIPLFICTVLLFTAVDFGPTMSFVYYLIVGMVFWTFYTAYVIPFFALGAELTQDYKERNTLRSVAGFFIYIAVWIATAGPMMVLDMVTEAGGTPQISWMIAAAVFGGIGLITALICWNFTRGKELTDTNTELMEEHKEAKVNILKHYKQLFEIKSFKMLLGTIFSTCVCFSVTSAAFVYLMSNNLGLSAKQQALYWTCSTIMTFIIIPICNFLANKLGKKQAFILLELIAIIACVVFFLKGIGSFSELILYAFLYQLSNVCFWTIGYSLTYDVCEIDEFINNQRREGSITGLASFGQKLGSAVGIWLSGLLLTFVGYDGTAEVQTASSLQGILTLNTIVPAIFIGIAAIFMFLYPINSSNFTALREATALKKEGKPYSIDGFKELLSKKDLAKENDKKQR